MAKKHKQKIDSSLLVDILEGFKESKKYKKPNPLPEFTIEECRFIRDLIFWKQKDLAFLYIANHIGNKTEIGMNIFSSKRYRQYLFLKGFFQNRGNSAKAARLAGYSPKTARQQGYRILKNIREPKRK